jgi:hypothetical protein
MPTVSSIDRTASDISTLVHENYVNEIKPWLAHNSPLAGLFAELGDGGYQMVGEKLVIARDNKRRGGFIATDGYIPEPQVAAPINLEFTAARLYASGAVDNFLQAIVAKPGAFADNFVDRLMLQMMDAVETGTTRHIHGGSDAIVCKVTSRTSSTVVVVEDGYGFNGASPTMFLEGGVGELMTSLDVSAANAVLGTAELSSVAHNTSASTATLTFASSIEGSGTIAAGDYLVFASAATGAAHYVNEFGRAPLGLLDIVDPADAETTYGGLTESTTARINPVRRASADFGQVEIMEFLAEIAAKSASPVNSQTHVITMQDGVKIELAKELLPFQQQAQLGRELHGGWTTVKIGEFDILSDMYHLPTVAYALCPEDLHVVDLDGEPAVWAGDGSQFQRMTDYDGKSWFLRHYVQRFASRRNRLGALTGVSNPNFERYAAIPN